MRNPILPLRLGMAALVFAVTAPVAARQSLPAPADATEAVVVGDVARLIAKGGLDLGALDSLLARLPRPTPWRGIVQGMRAQALLDTEKIAQARAAADEAIRLTPGLAFPHIPASYVLTFAGSPQRGADTWLEASIIDPDAARQTPSYWMLAMVGRLMEAGDTTRAEKVKVRMDEIGMATLLAPARSSAALSRFRATFAQNGAAAARPLISAIASPKDLLGLYVDRRYEAVWPDISRWAGDDFHRVQDLYLGELRREWQSSHGMDAATNYARALTALEADDATIELFLPELADAKIKPYIFEMEFLAPVVARAMTETGRAPEGAALLSRVNRAMPTEATALKLNLSGNLVRQSYLVQDWGAVARGAADWIKIAQAQGVAVNEEPVRLVMALKICAMEHLGRTSEAAAPRAAIVAAQHFQDDPAMTVFICEDDLASARRLVIAKLDDPDTRTSALLSLQPELPSKHRTPQSIVGRRFMDRLRSDPAIRTAANKVGRILPQPVLQRLPKGFDPGQEPQPKPVPGAI